MGSFRRLSIQGRVFLEGNERCKLVKYPDPPGQTKTFSIGWGHQILPTESWPNGMTQDQADAMLTNDLRKYEGCVNSCVNIEITQAQFDALVDFTYNEGCEALLDSTLLNLLNAGNYGEAADQFLRWDKDEQKGVLVDDPILLARRKLEMAMFLSELPEEPDA